MISIRVKVRGLQEFIAKNERVIQALERGDLTEEIAKKTKNRAKYRAPRKSGKLVSRIDYKMKGPHGFTLTCDATNEVGFPYPELLEFQLSRYIKVGTPENPRIIRSSSGKTAYLPYMRWALWRTMLETDKIFKEKIMRLYK